MLCYTCLQITGVNIPEIPQHTVLNHISLSMGFNDKPNYSATCLFMQSVYKT